LNELLNVDQPAGFKALLTGCVCRGVRFKEEEEEEEREGREEEGG